MEITVPGGLRRTLRLEGALEFAVAIALYAHVSGAWLIFASAFLAPDLAMLGYLVDARTGAAVYNAAHSYVGPALVGLCGITFAPAALPFALIWAAHIGFDRALGYGLKSRSGFRATHLGPIGHGAA
ncbi:MAG TPA: DUF4260 domain-containing protein [Candidatus Limnocylindria bacterium]|jgi:hypothetical protein|nr:DUF4260 domain-containing protein [Candidatus Limnocylindria bacterium]